jgi:hypothetical protein
MTAAVLLADLIFAGVTLFVEGGKLRFRSPPGAYTPAMRQAVAEKRSELLALLTQNTAATDHRREQAQLGRWLDARECYLERAAIMEYDGGLPRPHAEALALADLLQNADATRHCT